MDGVKGVLTVHTSGPKGDATVQVKVNGVLVWEGMLSQWSKAVAASLPLSLRAA